MTCETAKEAWDTLAEEFQGDQKARQMEVLNLRREMEMLKMKEGESVKEYADKVMQIVNQQQRMLGEELKDSRVEEKILVSLPEKFEAKISSHEDSKDLTKISLSELINALHVVEQSQSMRHNNEVLEGAMYSQVRGKGKFPARKNLEESRNQTSSGNKFKGKKEFPPCPHCGRTNHTENFCWVRPGVQCKICKQFGHFFKICKSKQEQKQLAQVDENAEDEEERLFFAVTTQKGCTENLSPDSWLIDSGCTNHMTPDPSIFSNLDRNYSSNVRIGNESESRLKERE